MEKLNSRLTSLLSRKFILLVLALFLVTFFVDVDPAIKLETIKWIVLGGVAVQGAQNAISNFG